METRIKAGITHGDINGIGYEIILKTLSNAGILEMCTPIVYGSSKIASYHKKLIDLPNLNLNLVKNAQAAVLKRANIINCYEQEAKIDIGLSTQIAGHLSLHALEAATDDLMNNRIDILVTAPINKKNIQTALFTFPGHTEYLAKKSNTSNYLMLMVADNLKIGVVTGHAPLKNVPSIITEELILKKLQILNQSLVQDFGIRRPKIAVLSLNPHVGDEGLLGNEEATIIIPAIKKAFDNKKILAFGPYSADGFFGSSEFKNYDAVLAMYHDQGMIPFKTLSFENGVNYTAGLPFIRTSPAHGVAYDIAGKGIASPDSFKNALYLAIDIFNNRKLYNEISLNPLKTTAPIAIEDDIPDEIDSKDRL